ncbi:hypothetical protein [Lacinutrix algicola]|uniref:hypothetical protein n=1 Tax=Lacinutrix algicola TaxID=342954 RepID=UPI0006E43BD0|nr:hypothetical protein [Lacinutrix algicola]
MEDKIFEVTYDAEYQKAEHLKNLVKLFSEFETQFRYTNKIKVSIRESIVSNPNSIPEDSVEILEEGLEIRCVFHGIINRDEKFQLSEPPNLYPHIKRKLEKLLEEDLEKFQALNNNEEEE